MVFKAMLHHFPAVRCRANFLMSEVKYKGVQDDRQLLSGGLNKADSGY